MKTLYEQNPELWDDIDAQGRPCIAEMAKHFDTPIEMDLALGYTKAVGNWIRRGGEVGTGSEKRAKRWLEGMSQPSKQADAPSQSVTFLCIADPATAAKVQKVLGLMGCEFVEM